MASPNSGTSSGSTSLVQNSGSEEDLRQLMDQRKRKRKISNRESARRSRMRKQQHLDELTARVAELRKENGQIIAGISATTQQYLAVEGENSILRAQEAELSHRLQSLNEIIAFLDAGNNGGLGAGEGYFSGEPVDGFGLPSNPWNYLYQNQPIMAAADFLQY
ncbi:bZIP transcription factor 44 [Diospyros lotus]|uniref:bZIP transcription factor 44 n=1 Tax=Diospyros lotus TaxID=55363 RepID=UPI00224D3516|nr:bZIP transcription factor 44 [Diospyros lotus]